MLIDSLRRSVLSSFIPTLDSELYRHLADCSTVLDLGCGPNSPVARIDHLVKRVGVEPFHPYLERAKAANTHHSFFPCLISELELPENSFDAVVMIDVLEHMTEEEGLNAVALAEKWAIKKVIINSPNGFIPQMSLDGNPLQEHKSGWSYDRMVSLGFQSYGLAGPKFFRHEVESQTMGDDLLTTIRFRPKMLWFAFATVLQPFTYRFPRFAFSLMSVKTLDKP